MPTEEDITGDVKYHLGATGQFTAMSGEKIKVSLAANPSHLEAVDPVLEGIARAKRDRQPVPADYPVLDVYKRQGQHPAGISDPCDLGVADPLSDRLRQ